MTGVWYVKVANFLFCCVCVGVTFVLFCVLRAISLLTYEYFVMENHYFYL